MKTLAEGLYAKPSWQWLLSPLSMLFWLVTKIRTWLYKNNILQTYHSPLIVITVGNISVGGNGKTPVVMALIEYFESKGTKSAVLTRGFGGKLEKFPFRASQESKASLIGDEAAMIQQRFSVPVIIDPKRVRGIKYIEQALDVDVVICDDGMQHYALGRDVELCVMDSRGIGNGFMLPMGPLRESPSRLKAVDMVLVNGGKRPTCLNNLKTTMVDFSLEPAFFENLKTQERLSLADAKGYFKDVDLFAIAGIGYPQRFFDTLVSLGLVLKQTNAYADHYAYTKSDLDSNQVILMTEKDAIKCREFAHSNCWFLQVNARLPEDFFAFIHSKTDKKIKETDNGI